MEIKAQIELSQKELAGIRTYHQEYLNRRAARDTRTSTDILMEQHQEQIGRALDLLEALKAIVEE